MGKGKGTPELDAIDMRGNLIKNGTFRQLKWWDEVHKSNTEDTYSITARKNHIVFERSNSGSDGGKVGVIQNLDSNVNRYQSLILSLDVCIENHTLKDTGYWGRKHGGLGELPLMISLKYQDVNDGLQFWSIGFITRSHRIKDIGSQQNITLVREGEWSRHEFDLMKDGFRRDSSGNVMPRPKKVLQINVSGKGWDFKSALGNLKLSSKRARERTKPHPATQSQSKSRSQSQPQSKSQSQPPQRKGTRTQSPTPKTPPKKAGLKPRSKPLKKPTPGTTPTRRTRDKKPASTSPSTPKNPPQKSRSPPSPPPKKTESNLPKSFKYDRVYVDASNVAHGVDLKRPLVSNIVLINDKLREIGFQTVIIIADASLRHKIDDPKAFEKLIDSGIVSQAPAKTSADEFLIGFAKQKNGYIVTNDKLMEWRKKDDWAKKNLDKLCIQFMIHEDMVMFVGFPN